jgi:two-component system sensor histidine kinase UhpB
MIDITIQTVRRICSNMGLSKRDHTGLVAAIQWQAEELRNKTGIAYNIALNPENIALNEKNSITIFRILQELLTNVAYREEATEIKIRLEKRNSELYLIIEDNGRGITAEEISKTLFFGLTGMRERIRVLGGEVRISSVQGQGTTMKANLPLRVLKNHRRVVRPLAPRILLF